MEEDTFETFEKWSTKAEFIGYMAYIHDLTWKRITDSTHQAYIHSMIWRKIKDHTVHQNKLAHA